MGRNPNFDISLLDGEAAEDALARLLLKEKVEVKRERRCWRERPTGNVCIETHQGQPRRPSGINTTEADWWAIEYDDDAWVFMTTERLKEIVLAVKGDRPAVPFGDNHNYGVLVPIERLVEPVQGRRHLKEAA